MKRLIYLAALALVACGSPNGLYVMSFNMRYDNPEDGDNNWQFRRERVARVIEAHRIDVVGTQELLVNQFNDLRGLLPAYEAVGVGREDGAEQGEFNAVFFRRDRFTALSSGTFWLSETPEAAGSKGWDGACERVATWVVLRDAAGSEFFFINTHLDHQGIAARSEGVKLLVERIDSLRAGRPVVLTGDFNAEPESSVIAHMQATGVLLDARNIAARCEGPAWSFADFGAIPEAERPLIDYIFVSDGVAVAEYEVLSDRFEGDYLSDHAPVMAKIEIEKETKR